MKKKDIAYTLKIDDEPLFKGHPFDFHFRQYKAYGACMNMRRGNIVVPIYTPQLTTILFTKKVKAWNRDEQKEDSFNGEHYLDTYLDGCIEGIKYFEKEYGINLDTLYGANSEAYVRDLHKQYFHSGKSKISGWSFAKNSFPLVITHEEIKSYGYYSGIVYCVEELIRKHGNLFAKFHFDKCVKDEKYQIEKKELEANVLNQKVIAMIHYYENKQITRKNGDTIAKGYGYTSGEKLFQLFTRYSSRANRIGVEETRKKNLNKLKLLEIVILHLDKNPQAKKQATEDMNTLKAKIEDDN